MNVEQLGPWENRSHLCPRHPSPFVVAMHLDERYSVQRYRYPEHPGVDHLIIRRHDEGVDVPWQHRQQIKDRLAPDGQRRVGVEILPPRLRIVDDCNLYHVWVMPLGWELGVGLHRDDPGSTQLLSDDAKRSRAAA